MTKDNIIEIITVILLGVCSVLISWNSWQSSLYSGMQDTSYTQATIKLTEANSKYSETLQAMNSDFNNYREFTFLKLDLERAKKEKNESEAKTIEEKINYIYNNDLSSEALEAIEWSKSQDEGTDPFSYKKYSESMFNSHYESKAEGERELKKGKEYNDHSDVLNKASNFASIALFFLGILNIFKKNKIKLSLIVISLAFMIYATYLTTTIPIV